MTTVAEAPAVEVVPTTTMRSWWLVSLRDSLRYGRTRIGLLLAGITVIVALAGPALAPHSPTELVGAPYAAPTSTAPLGTDYLGEDVLSRVLYGGRSVLWMALLAGFIGTVGGTVLGILAGYGRRLLDEGVMRCLDVLLAIPQIVFVLLFVAMLGSKPLLIVILVGLSWMPAVARTVRAATSDIVHREFVEAAEVIGTPRRKVLANEVLPNLMTLVLVELGLRIAWSIAVVAAISYLGFGISPPKADWGLMINENSAGLSIQPWALVAPIVCIAGFSIGMSLLADGLSRAVSGTDRRVDL